MELKPCPYCGETPDHDMLINQGCDDPTWWVECKNDDCHVSPGLGDSCRITARERWNTRATDSLLKEMAESLRKLLTKVAWYGYDFQLETEFEEGKVVMQKYHEQEETNAE